MFKRIVKLKALLLMGCILFAGCVASPGEGTMSSFEGNWENASISSETDGWDPAQDGAGQDQSASGASSGPGGTTQIPEENGEAFGTEGEEPVREDKKSGPEVEEKKLHLDMASKIRQVGEDKLLVYGNKEILLLDMYTMEVLKRANNEAYGDKFTISEIFQREDGICMICGELQEELHHGGKSSQAVIDYDSELQPVLNLKETLCLDYKGLIWQFMI